MKKIDKNEPGFFSTFKQQIKPSEWRDCPVGLKKQMSDYMLLNEQLFLCGYTEIFIDDDSHIDHYIKRSINNGYCYDWNNLIVAVNDEDFGAKYKDNVYGLSCLRDYDDIINPVSDDAHLYFRYTTNGVIHPAVGLDALGLIKAEKTIQVFNLNDDSLKRRRVDVFEVLINIKSGGVEKNNLLQHIESLGFYSFANYMINNYILD